MKMGNKSVIYEVRIKQYMYSVLNISGRNRGDED